MLFGFPDITGCKEAGNLKPSKIEPIANVNFESSGCFHWEKANLRVLKLNNDFFAELKIGKDIRQTAKLDSTKIRVFSTFIEELRKIEDEGFCTTVDTYDVIYKNERIKKVDGHCDWRGFDNLKKSLFNAN